MKNLFFWRRLSRKKRAYLNLILGAILVVLIPLALSSFRNPDSASAAWFDDNFAYRQNATITNSGSTQTDFQISVTLDTATLITASKMQSDCDDIRITDVNGKIIPHWVEQGTNACNTSTTAIWTKIPSIPTPSATIYIYYGSTSAANAESGEKVFYFFDDFTGSSLSSKWTVLNGSTPTVSSGSVRLTYAGGSDNGIAASYTSLSQSVVEFRGVQIMQSPSYRNRLYFGTLSGTTFSASTLDDGVAGGNKDFGFFYDGSNAPAEIYLDTWRNINLNTTDTFNAKYLLHGSVVDAYYTNRTTNTEIYSLTNLTPTISNSNVNAVALQAIESTASDFKVDTVFIRKYAATEPTVASPATEEKSPGPIAYWQFDEGTGTTAQDSTQQNNDGTLSGATWQTEDQCIAGKCLYFDGSNDVVTVSNTVSGIQTVSFWIRPITTSEQIIDINGTASISVSSGTISATSFTSPTIYVNGVVSSTLTANTWQYVTVTTGTALSGSAIKIGQISTNYGQAFIDDVKLYPYARSASQVLADYNSRGSVKGSSSSLGGNTETMKQLSNGLVGYWKMDGTASPSTDSSGNGNSGTWSGNVAATTGKFGNATTFDGTGDYITATSIQPTNVTVSTWVKWSSVPSTEYDYILAQSNASGGIGSYFLRKTAASEGGDFEFFIYNGSSYEPRAGSDVTPVANTWYHIVGTFDGSTVKIYVNGELKGTSNRSTSIAYNGGSLILGAQGNAINAFNGIMDETRIYNRAITPAEVTALYNFAPGPVGYWNFDENTGSTANDTSGNGQTGTWQGTLGSQWKPGKYGGAGNFNGTNNYLTTSLTYDVTKPHTITFWVKPQARSGSGIQTLTYRGNYNVYTPTNHWDGGYLNLAGTQATFADYDGTESAINVSTTLGEWTYFTYVHDGTNLNVYKNGVFVSSIAARTPNVNAAATLFIGQNQAVFADYLASPMDDLKIYNYARTQQQIVQDMNAGHPAPGSPVGSALGHWDFDEGYGTTANNVGNQGSTLNGTLTSMASPATATSGWTQAGKFGKGLVFDGSNDAISMGDPSGGALDFGAGADFTLSAWIKPTSGADGTIIDKAGSASGDVYGIWVQNSTQTLCLTINSANTCSSGTQNLMDGLWHYVGVTFDRDASATFYVDGRSVGTTSISSTSGTDLSSTGNFYIGRYSSAVNYTGSIDEVKIYNSALTADQVKVDMNRSQAQVMGALSDNSSYQKQAANQEYCIPGDSTSCASPLARWDFEEGAGTAVNDTTGNANTGTWNGTLGSQWKPGKIGSGGNFNGTNNRVALSDSTSLSPSNITINTWVKRTSDSGSWESIINNWKDDAVNQRSYILVIDPSDKVACDFSTTGTNSYGASVLASTTSISVGNWYFITCSFDGTTGKIFVNGIQEDSATGVSGNLFDDSNSKNIGSSNDTTPNEFFPGLIDQARIYSYPRSAAQVAWDYNRGAPVGWWKFDECQGATAYDSSTTGSGASNGNTGTITPGSGGQTAVGTCTGSANTMWKDGAIGKYNSSLDFDGTDDYVDAGGSSNLIGLTQGTFSAWAKFSSTSTTNSQAVVGVGNGGNGTSSAWGLQYRSDSGSNKEIQVYSFPTDGSAVNLSAYTPTNTITDTNWHHIAVVVDSSTIYVYVDGISRTLTGTIANKFFGNATQATKLTFGRHYQTVNPNYLAGQIDDPRVYNYALTATQVKQVMNQGSAIRFGPVTGSP